MPTQSIQNGFVLPNDVEERWLRLVARMESPGDDPRSEARDEDCEACADTIQRLNDTESLRHRLKSLARSP